MIQTYQICSSNISNFDLEPDELGVFVPKELLNSCQAELRLSGVMLACSFSSNESLNHEGGIVDSKVLSTSASFIPTKDIGSPKLRTSDNVNLLPVNDSFLSSALISSSVGNLPFSLKNACSKSF